MAIKILIHVRTDSSQEPELEWAEVSVSQHNKVLFRVVPYGPERHKVRPNSHLFLSMDSSMDIQGHACVAPSWTINPPKPAYSTSEEHQHIFSKSPQDLFKRF